MPADPRLPLRRVVVDQASTIEDYTGIAHLAASVSERRLEAEGVATEPWGPE